MRLPRSFFLPFADLTALHEYRRQPFQDELLVDRLRSFARTSPEAMPVCLSDVRGNRSSGRFMLKCFSASLAKHFSSPYSKHVVMRLLCRQELELSAYFFWLRIVRHPVRRRAVLDLRFFRAQVQNQRKQSAGDGLNPLKFGCVHRRIMYMTKSSGIFFRKLHHPVNGFINGPIPKMKDNGTHLTRASFIEVQPQFVPSPASTPIANN